MAMYLLKSSACLLVFYLFYQLVLERQSNHTFKRAYLLGTLLLALGIPLLPLTETVLPQPEFLSSSGLGRLPGTTGLAGDTEQSFQLYLVLAYLPGLLFFGYLFARGIYRLAGKVRRNPKLRGARHTKVLLGHPESPHAFLRYLFLNGKEYKSGQIPPEVLAHEMAHIRQYHSLDLLLAESLLLLFWFNPLVWLYRNAIRLNHEFLADREVIRQGFPARGYQQALLQFSERQYQPAFAHAINYSSIKKRIVIMKTSTSKTRLRVASILLVPVLALALLSFSSTRTVYLQKGASPVSDRPFPAWDSYEDPTGGSPQTSPGLPQHEDPVTGKTQQGASRREMKEYNTLAGKYNRMIEAGEIRIDKKEVMRLKVLYGRMSDKQRADAEPFPAFPPPPPAPRPVAAVRPAQAALPAQPAKPGHPAHAAPAAQPPMPPSPAKDIAPVPPPPPDPMVHLKELAGKGAEFFYEGEQVSAEAALKLFRSGKANQIQVNRSGDGHPQVRLSD